MEALEMERDTPSAYAPFSSMPAPTQQGEDACAVTELGHDAPMEIPVQVGDPN
jgi:hypothetical protein